MSAPPVRIRVGASLDSSVEKVFASVEARALRAAQNTARAQTKVRDATKDAAAGMASAWGRASSDVEKGVRRSRDAQVDAWRQIGRVAEQELNRQSRAVFREVARQEREIEASAKRTQDRFARRASFVAARTLVPYAPIASFARRTAADLLRGAGVDANVGSMVSKNVNRQSLSVAISNSAYQEGTAGPAGQRVAPSEIQSRATEIAKGLALDPTQVLEGVQAFVKRTGDLNLALDALPQMAKLAAAANVSVADMMTAAGAAATNLRNVDDKTGALDGLMRNMIAQGKIGAIEMEDFAREIAKLAPQANRFEGTSAQNMRELAGLAQLSMASGGATNATQAATSVARLVDTLSTPARAKAFHALRIQTETTNAQGMKVLRDPVEVILDALRKTAGDPTKLKGLFSSSIGSRPAEALAGMFREAGGGEAGIAAARKQLATFSEGKFSDTAIASNLATYLASDAAKAQQFQTSLEDVVQRTQVKLLPALEELAPNALRVANALGDLAAWIPDHIPATIAAAFGLAVARGLTEALFRSAVEKMIANGREAFKTAKDMFGAGGGSSSFVPGVAGSAFFAPQVLGKNVGAAGAIGAGLAATAAVAIADDQNDRLKRVSGGLGAFDLMGEMWNRGTFNPFEAVDKYQNEQARAEAKSGPDLASVIDELKKQNEQLRAELMASRNGVQRVEVTNLRDKDDRPSQL